MSWENGKFKKTFERFADNAWVERLAKLGYAAKGFIYIIFGTMAMLAAMDIGGRPRGLSGALALVAGQPFGRIGLILIAVGLAGFVLRRLVQIFVPPDGQPKFEIFRILRPIGYFFSGLANIGITFTALQLAFGWQIESSGNRNFNLKMLLNAQPFIKWLIFIVGLVIIGVAVFHFYMAIRKRFEIDLRVGQMSRTWRKITFVFGVIGYASRGAAFLIGGGILVYVGWFAGQQLSGFGNAIRTIEATPFGTSLLILIAVGFIAYGLFLIFVVRHLRLIATW